MRLTSRTGCSVAAALVGFATAANAALPYRDAQLATGRAGMVVTQQPLATRAGLEVLRAGGNAMDAAIAAALALSVVHPQAGNLGGGGFLLYYRAQDSLCTFLDFRETAPAAARPDMYLDAHGEVDTLKARVGPWSAGVPGSPAGLYLAWSKYGTRSWRSLLAPAIRYAQDGFPVNEELAEAVQDREADLRRFPATAALFLPKGRPLRAGDKLVQKDLARTLRLFAQSRPLTFYEGAVADLVQKDMDRVHGPFTAADWPLYRAVERVPLRGRYRDLQVWCAPPPSSGGVTLLEILAQLEYYDLQATGPRSTYRVHLTSEAMARAFADRNTFLGDPAYVVNPIAGLLAPAYIASLQGAIAMDKASPPGGIQPGNPWKFQPGPRFMATPDIGDSLYPVPNRATEGNHTTHLSVVDAQGNIVALTTTLNDEFGSAYVVPGAGFFLNNEMDDFVAKPGTANMYGLVGSATNGIAPGKRPLSSMCPTLVFRAGRPWLVLGSPGGPRIITTVLNILLDRRDHGLTLEAAVANPRFHHQWQPDVVYYEPEAFGDDVKKALQAMGHGLRQRARYSSAQCIEIEPGGTLRGVSDPRSRGAAMGY